jgi:hypothetical protein
MEGSSEVMLLMPKAHLPLLFLAIDQRRHVQFGGERSIFMPTLVSLKVQSTPSSHTLAA